MEVRRTRGESAQNRSFGFADVGTVSADQRTAGIRDVKSLPGKRTGDALQREDRQSGNIESWRVRIGVGYADVQRRLDRMISDVRRIMAGAASTGDELAVQHVVETGHVSNIDQLGIEDDLAARDRLAISGLVVCFPEARPRGIQVKDVWS